MTPSTLVLLSLALGVLIGAVLTATVFLARAASRRRAAELRPELPEIATSILHEMDTFAVILDASLSPVYANPAARDDTRITGEQLREPEFLRRSRRVMSTGATDVIEPEEGSTIRLQIVRLQRRFLVVFADDLGEEQRVNAMRRDFIANVNPLSVLTAWNVMRSKHELETAPDGWIWLDRRRTTKFKVDDDGLVAAAERDGRPAVWVSCADVERQPEETAQVFWATPGTPLKTVMLAMHRSQTAPVALFDEASRFVGAIGVRDVLSAVLRR